MHYDHARSLVERIFEAERMDCRSATTVIAALASLVTKVSRQEPCHHEPECLLTGRCPRDPVCDN